MPKPGPRTTYKYSEEFKATASTGPKKAAPFWAASLRR